MERLIRLLDQAEDSIVAAAFSLRRKLARKPKERRKTPRTPAASQDMEHPDRNGSDSADNR